jgi:hypothetical protein
MPSVGYADVWREGIIGDLNWDIRLLADNSSPDLFVLYARPSLFQ